MRIIKIVVVILIVADAATAAGIGYYTTTRPTPSPKPTPSPQPTFTPSPFPTMLPTPTAAAEPTPTGSNSPTPPTSSPTEQTIQERVRDSVMRFVESNHPETASFMENLIWTGGRVTPSGIIGAETYMYYSLGWNVTINYPVVPNPTYTITADYSTVSVGIPYRIIWQGTWKNEVINETSYIFAQ